MSELFGGYGAADMSSIDAADGSKGGFHSGNIIRGVVVAVVLVVAVVVVVLVVLLLLLLLLAMTMVAMAVVGESGGGSECTIGVDVASADPRPTQQRVEATLP